MMGVRTKRGWRFVLLAGVIFTLLTAVPAAHADASGGAEKPDSASIPVRVNIRLLRTLERQLSDIERVLVDQVKISQARVRNVTMPLQNYIDDVVLATGRYTDIYPKAIYDVLLTEFKTSKPKTQIAGLLVDYQEKGRFKSLAESQESKKPERGKVGS